ncbi:alkyldihydroxyacetonephosphate synthase-like [Malaya genurostris]|uniref:alkyldihydroxyacetonephosphate synthase-like n=1 Tax=Malaya genurostris TaxID=325434 RepID=UPI0026F3CAB3|nr:alkyldihydroxyacetonephosphate synthase-like [Malaya genurostris]
MNTQEAIQITSVFPKRRQDMFRWDGWGYKDCRFVMQDGVATFQGMRYSIGGKKLGNLMVWIEDMFKIDGIKPKPDVKPPTEFPEPIRSEAFLNDLSKAAIDWSEDGMDRVMRCHGQTLTDVENLRRHKFTRLPDLIIWPVCHEQVVSIVELATIHNVALIPVGGNTAVSLSSTTPNITDRTIAAVDMTQMNRLLWLSEENMTACFETGIVGQDIERELRKHGFTLGHEPDSHEFSTLGGWIATRASGMKKNRYGNIEDIVVRTKMVTGNGQLEKQFTAPRVSIGPDFDHIVFGSEGTYGIVTEAVVKIHYVPEVRHYGSLVFADFDTGVSFLRELSDKQLRPASIRLIDNVQFKCGMLLDPTGQWYSGLLDIVKHFYLTFFCGFRMDRVVAVTLLFEGQAQTVEHHEQEVYVVAKKYGGIKGGEHNGRKGYLLTFLAGYMRDFAWDINIVGESFETSTSWSRCCSLTANVKACIARECQKRGIQHFAVSSRVTQSYDDGCCVYFYLLFKHPDQAVDSLKLYREIEEVARDEILACGGTLSHHHGVGKLRNRWYPACVSQTGVGLYKAIKKELDPKNIFAAGNLLQQDQKLLLNYAVDYLEQLIEEDEDEDFMRDIDCIYIEPPENDGNISGEDEANENEGGTIDALSRNQLNPCVNCSCNERRPPGKFLTG